MLNMIISVPYVSLPFACAPLVEVRFDCAKADVSRFGVSWNLFYFVTFSFNFVTLSVLRRCANVCYKSVAKRLQP